MFRTMLGGKIHRAVVTEADLNYVGSITVDLDLLDAAGICVNEKVQIVNNNNGARLETHSRRARQRRDLPQARLVQKGDIVFIMSYVLMSNEEAKNHRPNVVLVNEQNHIRGIIHYEPPHTVL